VLDSEALWLDLAASNSISAVAARAERIKALLATEPPEQRLLLKAAVRILARIAEAEAVTSMTGAAHTGDWGAGVCRASKPTFRPGCPFLPPLLAASNLGICVGPSMLWPKRAEDILNNNVPQLIEASAPHHTLTIIIISSHTLTHTTPANALDLRCSLSSPTWI
jgi:hypothetical protein